MIANYIIAGLLWFVGCGFVVGFAGIKDNAPKQLWFCFLWLFCHAAAAYLLIGAKT